MKSHRIIPLFVKLISFFVILMWVVIANTFMLIRQLIWGIGIYDALNIEAIMSSLPFSILAMLILIDVFKLLDYRYVSNVELFKRVFYFSTLQTLTTTTIAFFIRQFSFPRGTIIYGYIILFVLTFTSELIARQVYMNYSKKREILVVYEDSNSIHKTIEQLERNQSKFGFSNVSSVHLKDFDSIIEQVGNKADVFLTNEMSTSARNEVVLKAKAHHAFIFVIPNSYELSIKSAESFQINDVLLYIVHNNELSIEKRLFKRVFDIIFSILFLLLTSPVLGLVALLIKISSPGPVIFKQERVTYRFKLFNIYKFRTMFENAEALTGPVIAEKDDPRITPLGKVLRRFRIDEFPQFFNVLMGDMSVVGPRAERMVFVNQFLQNVPGYDLRYKVKAGITGLAQIFGDYDSSAENKLRFDLSYVNDYSIMTDLRLVLLTIKKAVF